MHPQGNVRFPERPPYSSHKVHSFSNVQQVAGHPLLLPGTTHVAIGFLDLGSLCASVAGWDVSSAAGVLRWVGFDSSAAAVAQSLAVHKMLQMGADVDAVLQVGVHAGSLLVSDHA